MESQSETSSWTTLAAIRATSLAFSSLHAQMRRAPNIRFPTLNLLQRSLGAFCLRHLALSVTTTDMKGFVTI